MAWAGGTLFAGLAGPFGTVTLYSWDVRLLFWAILLGASVYACHFLRPLVARATGEVRPLVYEIIVTLLMVCVVWLIAMGLERLFAPLARAPFHSPAQVAGYVALTLALLHLVVRNWPEGRARPAPADPEVPTAELPVPFLRRRLPDPTDPVTRLEADGHFVIVTTREGSHRLRMRLADAVGEMQGVEGIMTHRSHWVVTDEVERAERDGVKVWLVTRCGDRVPVSRTYQPEVEAAGLLRDLD